MYKESKYAGLLDGAVWLSPEASVWAFLKERWENPKKGYRID